MCTANKPEIAGGNWCSSRLFTAIAWERVSTFPTTSLFKTKIFLKKEMGGGGEGAYKQLLFFYTYPLFPNVS